MPRARLRAKDLVNLLIFIIVEGFVFVCRRILEENNSGSINWISFTWIKDWPWSRQQVYKSQSHQIESHVHIGEISNTLFSCT